MKKPKTFNVFCEVYGVNLLVVLELEPEKVRPYLEKKYGVEWEYGDEVLSGGAVMDFRTWPFHVLWLRKLPKEDFIPKLAHEVFHHVLRVCEQKQVQTIPHINGELVDEAAAYLMEFYMREILKKIK